MIGSQHKCCFNMDRVMMTVSHHGNDNDDWQSAEKVCPAPLNSKNFHTAHPSFLRRLKIAAGKYLCRFPANQHAVVVTSADWKSSWAPHSCTNKHFGAPAVENQFSVRHCHYSAQNVYQISCVEFTEYSIRHLARFQVPQSSTPASRY